MYTETRILDISPAHPSPSEYWVNIPNHINTQPLSTRRSPIYLSNRVVDGQPYPQEVRPRQGSC